MNLSICIPTKNRPELIKNTISSIILNSEKCGIRNDIEIAISDASENDKTKDVVLDLIQKNPQIKIQYQKTKIEGFYNSIEALKLGSGDFLKLLNDYTKITEQGLRKIATYAKSDAEVVLFCDGNIKGSSHEFKTVDKLFCASKYWNTWSTAFGMKKHTFENTIEHIKKNNILPNKEFPHVTLILESKAKSSFIENEIVFENQIVGKKGGYNIFKNFSQVYLELLQEAVNNKVITKKTYSKIKYSLIFNFFPRWYGLTIISEKYKTEYTFDTQDSEIYLKKNFGILGYLSIIILANIYLLTKHIKSLKLTAI